MIRLRALAVLVSVLAAGMAVSGCSARASRCGPPSRAAVPESLMPTPASPSTSGGPDAPVVTRLVGGGPVAPVQSTVLDEASGVSETVLGNGLRVLVRPQPDNPMVTTMIWYAVGSRDEGVGETGLSHYLEHMLFKGTERLKAGEIDALTQRNGGRNNASTRYDATEYHFVFPADRWEVALEIEADRMRNANCPPHEFDLEKKVVLNELYIGLDDPYDVLSEAVGSALFPVGRYHHPIIGWEQDVVGTTRDGMLDYYRRHYHPERATLVVVGGVDRDRVIARAAELFGPIPAGGTKRWEVKEPPPRGETRLTLVQDTQVPRLLLAFRGVSILDPKEPHLDLVAMILAGDKTSRFERLLVDAGVAVEATCWNDSRRDDGAFVVSAQPAPGVTLDALEAAVKEVLAAFAADGPTASELKVAKAKVVAQQVFHEATSMGMASRLGSLAVVGDWRYVVRYPTVIEAATLDDVRDAARRVYDPTKAVVGRSLPKDPAPVVEGGREAHGGADGDDATEDAAGEDAAGADAADDAGGAGPAGREGEAGPVGQGDTRALRRGPPADPAAAKPPAAAGVIDRALTLDPLRVVLDNGLRVVVLRRTSAPVFHARLAVFDGRLVEAAPGLDAFAGALLMEGTTKRSAEAVAQAIGEVGGDLSAAAGGVSARVLSRDANLALELMAEVASSPAFAPEAVERVRGKQAAALDEELDTPRSVAQLAFFEEVYGAGHPMGRSIRGTKASIAAFARDEAVAHHARVFTPKNAALFVVTDLAPETVVEAVRRAFGSWEGGDAPVVDLPAPPAPRALLRRIDLPRAQTNTFVGHLGIRRNDPDFVALEVLDNVFGTGAGFTDRLSKEIRDRAGLAYSVFGNIAGSAGVIPGSFRMYAGTKPADAERARAMMREQLALLLAAPPSDDEVAGARAALRGGMISACEGADNLLALLALCERFELGFDYPRRYLDEVARTRPQDVHRVAKAHLRPEVLVEVVVGPAAAAPR